MTNPSHLSASIHGSEPHYYSRYKKLHDYIKSCNEKPGNQKIKYRFAVVDAGGQPALYFKADRLDLLENIIDKCDEWFDHGRFENGLVAVLHEQDVSCIKIPFNVRRIPLH